MIQKIGGVRNSVLKNCLAQLNLKEVKVQSTIPPEFKNWLDTFMAENHNTLKELAQY